MNFLGSRGVGWGGLGAMPGRQGGQAGMSSSGTAGARRKGWVGTPGWADLAGRGLEQGNYTWRLWEGQALCVPRTWLARWGQDPA